MHVRPAAHDGDLMPEAEHAGHVAQRGATLVDAVYLTRAGDSSGLLLRNFIQITCFHTWDYTHARASHNTETYYWLYISLNGNLN